ncbi:MAG TPA: chromosome segregation protein SMC, partial [Pseudobdellovibrionaceae bacterium]|nr:chromosome segregation protein SMC [Pseudobdellovibrionaceae bacterium]
AVERQGRECSRLTEQVNSQEEKIHELQEHLFEAREKKVGLDAEVNGLTDELQSLKTGFDGLQSEVNELRTSVATKTQEVAGVQRQLEMVTRSVDDLNSQLNRMSEDQEMYSEQMTESQYQLEAKKIEFEKLIDEVHALKASVSQQKNEYEIIDAELRAHEENIHQLNKQVNERQARMNEAKLKLDQAQLKVKYIIEQINEKYMIHLPDIYMNYIHREGDLVESEAMLKDLKDKVNKIGEVNLSAIEEYEETSKRYEFLTQQHQDLTDAKEQLRRVIERINKICSKRFKETFDLVNERFTKVFPVLFGGGEARLELVEDEEKGEMGIEIIAKPPGKKMQNVSLMSGGEKALTAVALIFSIFLVKPSPYCLLDEVDAPLDDANVFRFNDLVREMAKRSQIIVVTHNKHTMEVVGKLYGVTMQERGVSTMVSVSLQNSMQFAQA